jgi:hypothetical protein
MSSFGDGVFSLYPANWVMLIRNFLNASPSIRNLLRHLRLINFSNPLSSSELSFSNFSLPVRLGSACPRLLGLINAS